MPTPKEYSKEHLKLIKERAIFHAKRHRTDIGKVLANEDEYTKDILTGQSAAYFTELFNKQVIPYLKSIDDEDLYIYDNKNRKIRQADSWLELLYYIRRKNDLNMTGGALHLALIALCGEDILIKEEYTIQDAKDFLASMDIRERQFFSQNIIRYLPKIKHLLKMVNKQMDIITYGDTETIKRIELQEKKELFEELLTNLASQGRPEALAFIAEDIKEEEQTRPNDFFAKTQEEIQAMTPEQRTAYNQMLQLRTKFDNE